ncbi:MAG TPA: hypothetical protein VK203_03395 [Nostocaceae cyanobacterium]|nr:hypothetical protein [Nostocaceae cyanobacterium]
MSNQMLKELSVEEQQILVGGNSKPSTEKTQSESKGKKGNIPGLDTISFLPLIVLVPLPTISVPSKGEENDKD